MPKTTTSPLLWLPSAADGIQLTPKTTAWAIGDWVQVSASAPSDVYPAYLAVLPNNGAVVAQLSAEFDIAVGASGSEVVVATLRARVMADLWGNTATLPFGVIYDRIPSGSRVAARVRHSASANTNVYRVALGYFASLGGASAASSAYPTVTPLGSTTLTVTSASGTAWAFGAWVEILPAARVTGALAITGFIPAGITRPHEIQIGSGAAGSETPLITLPTGSTAGGGDGFHYIRFPRPLCLTAGARIAIRTSTGTTTASSFNPTIWHTLEDAGGLLWTDDFESAATLADSGYTGVGSVSKVAGTGAGGSQGVQASTDLGEFICTVPASGRDGSVTFDSKTSRNNVFGYVLEVRRASAWIVSIYRNDSAGGNDLEVYSNGSFTTMATASGFWDETTFRAIKVEWTLSTYNGASYNSDGAIRVYKDGALVVNLSAVQVSDSVGSGLSAWDNLTVAPQGELDNLDVYDNATATP